MSKEKIIKLIAAILVVTAFFPGCFENITGGSSTTQSPYQEEADIRLIPAQIIATDAEALKLFDSNNESVYAPIETKEIVIQYPSKRKISRLKVFGRSSYSITVYKGSGEKKEVINDLKYTGTDVFPTWNAIESLKPISTDTITLEITPLDSSNNGIKEIEIWSRDTGVVGSYKTDTDLSEVKTADDMESRVSKNSDNIKTFSSSGDISFSNKTEADPASVTVNVDIDPVLIKRAYITYTGVNIKTPAGVKTRINGSSWLGGNIEPDGGSAGETKLSLEINPAWLKQGTNSIDFSSLKSDISIKKLKIAVEFENGYNHITSVSDTNAFDRNTSTNAEINFDKPNFDINFGRKIESEYLYINFSGTGNSPFKIQSEKDNIWIDCSEQLNQSEFKAGWNKIKMQDGLSTRAIRIKFNSETAFKSEIAEVRVSGSQSGNSALPEIITSFPRNGEYFSRNASILGFVKPVNGDLGTDKINIADKAVKGISADGVMNFILAKEEAGFSAQADNDAWKAILIFNNGTQYSTKNLDLTLNLNNANTGSTTGTGTTGTTTGGSGTTTDTVSTDTEFRTIVDPKTSKSITYQDMTLDIPAGSVDKAVEIKIIPLNEKDLPKLDPGMTNVTTPFAGYRFLPHGSFKKDLTLKLGYAKNKIPAGHKEKDIVSFFFDENERKWKKLDTIQIDSTRMMVLSATNHFTDIINATLTTPEHPDPLSYNPNSIKDIKAGDPSSGMNMIEAPKASNTGDAGLAYPIEIPKGRNGMQPDVAIRYNSSGGNSWLGLGWDIHVSTIAVDTTFGVPRGNPTYTLDGTKLVYDTATQTYRPRVEGSFAKIEKKGDTWVVTDKNGTRSIYGETGNSKLNSRQWNLEKIIDANGNYIRYEYIKDSTDGVWLYLSKISYTGTGGNDGPYSVNFITENSRPDKTTNLRMGFKTALRWKLKEIEVRYKDQLIRKYSLQYKAADRFNKTLLEKIMQLGPNNETFNEHTFEYYDDIAETGADSEFRSVGTILNQDGQTNLLSSDGWDLGTSFVLAISPFSAGLNTSFGLKIGFGGGETFTRGVFMDIDGDGLPDYVFTLNNVAYYRKNSLSDKGIPTFSKPIPIDTLTQFHHLGSESNFGFNLGVMGSFIYLGGGGQISFSWSTGTGYFADANGDGLIDFVYNGDVYFNTLVDGKPTFSLNCPVDSGLTETTADFSATRTFLPDELKKENLLKKFYRDDPLLVWKAPFSGSVRIKGNPRLLPTKPLDSLITTDDGVRVSIERDGYVIWQNEITGDDKYNKETFLVGTDSVPVNKGDRIFFRVDSINDGNFDAVAWTPVIEYSGPNTNTTDENGFFPYKYNARDDFNITGNNAELDVPTSGTVNFTGSITKGFKTTDDVSLKIYLITEIRETDANNNPTLREIDRQEIYSKDIDRNSTGTFPVSLTGINVINNIERENGQDPDRNNDPKYARNKILCKIHSDTPIKLKEGINEIKADVAIEYTEAVIIDIDPKNSPTAWNPDDPKSYKPGVISRVSGDKIKDLKAPIPITYTTYPETGDLPPYSWKSDSSDRSGTATVEMNLSMLSNNSPDPFLNLLSDYTGGAKTQQEPLLDPLNDRNYITLAVKIVNNNELVKVVKKKYFIKSNFDSGNDIKFEEQITINPGDEVFCIAASDRSDIQKFVLVISPKITIGSKNFYDAATYLYRAKDKNDPFAGGFRNWYFARYNGENEGPLDPSKMAITNFTDIKVPTSTNCNDLNAQEAANNVIKNFTPMISMVKPTPLRETYPACPLGVKDIDSEGYKQWAAAVEEANRKIWEGHDKSCFIGFVKGNDTDLVISSTRVGQKYIKEDAETLALPVAKSQAGSATGAGRGRGTNKSTFSFSYGGNLMTPVVDLQASVSVSTTDSDYIDLNGDGYPDVIKSGSVRFSRPDGTYQPTESTNYGSFVRASDANNNGFSFPGTSGAHYTPESVFGADGAAEGTKGSNPSVSGNFSYSDYAQSSEDFIDINGDGLPDKVTRNFWSPVTKVKLNNGYGLEECNIALPGANAEGFKKNSSGSFTLGVGVSIDDTKFSFGASATMAEAAAKIDYIDVNGDGLPDKVLKEGATLPYIGFVPSGGDWTVCLNNGDGFDAPISWRGAESSKAISDNSNLTLNAGGAFTITIPIAYVGILINLGINGGGKLGFNTAQAIDIDGDGIVDHVVTNPVSITSKTGGEVRAVLSNIGKTHLLKSVTRPLGGKITLKYKRAGNTQDMPRSRWTMSQVTITDGNTSTYTTKYDYEAGKYDRYEREFYGFAKVTETKTDVDGNPLPEGTNLERNFITENYHQKGLETKSFLRGNGSDKKLYVQTISNYDLADSAGIITTVTERNKSYSPRLRNKTTEYFEDGGSVKSWQTYDYDKYGNVTTFTDEGDGVPKVKALIVYAFNISSYIMNRPQTIQVTGDKLYRHRIGSYDSQGRLTQLTQTDDKGKTAITDMQYDSAGNLIKITGPANESGQRYSETYSYDDTGNISAISDSFGYTSRATYDQKWGKPLSTTDINGNYMTYSYDQYGRTKRIYGPNDLGSGRATIEYMYEIAGLTAKCTTTNKPRPESNDTIDAVTTIDALKRVLQTTVTSERNGALGFTSSGGIKYDSLGRVTQQGEPEFNGALGSIKNATTFDYDKLGRVTTTRYPDGKNEKNTYGISGQYLTTLTTDRNGEPKTAYKDIRGRIRAIAENAGTTAYEYNPMGEITAVIDSKTNRTSITYDNFGRRTSINNPDTGLVSYAYDAAGNLVRKVTPNQLKRGAFTSYRYTFNRLDRIDYKDMPSVIYTYGSPGAGNNRAGRIVTVENGNMKEERSYGKMGETVKTVRSIKQANSWTSYEMKYAWDNLGRMTQLIYPDGEILSYTYNRGGLLKAAIGRSKEKTETYVKEILYDEFGHRTKVEYGNGIKSEYTYDPLNHRLNTLTTKGADNKTYQNLTYEYDAVGNIITRTNNGFVTTDKTEKTATQTYGYDNMHRLINSTGTYSNESWIPFNTTRTNEYTNQFKYDNIGNITEKNQTHRAKYADTGKTATIEETTYTLKYTYGAKPHAVTSDGAINGADKLDQPRTYSYDDNGNMIAWSEKGTGRNRTMAWDEENRLTKVTDASITEFKYDDTGMRISKKGNSGEVLYVNPNYTIRDGGIISKHVFAGNTRVASKVASSEAGGTYYYHADHLGSSSVVTNQTGAYHESLEYFPYGETWVHEKANSKGFTTPYQFTSKELDPETNLYYHGARYRDARLNNWLSPDPILNSYLPSGNKDKNSKLPGHGGVYNSVNLNLYHYAGNNPVIYVDPDGRAHKNLRNEVYGTLTYDKGLKMFRSTLNGKEILFSRENKTPKELREMIANTRLETFEVIKDLMKDAKLDGVILRSLYREGPNDSHGKGLGVDMIAAKGKSSGGAWTMLQDNIKNEPKSQPQIAQDITAWLTSGSIGRVDTGQILTPWTMYGKDNTWRTNDPTGQHAEHNHHFHFKAIRKED